MKSGRRLLALLIATVTVFALASPAQAAKNPDSGDPAIQAAMALAGRGQTDQLEALLAGPKAEQTQAALRAWLERRGGLDSLTPPVPDTTAAAPDSPPTPEDVDRATTLAAAATGPAICGGYYNCTCKGYNGVSMNWYGKVVLSCHGYYDLYISGTHVLHGIPDLWPRNGGTMSLGCAKGIIGVAAAIILYPTGGLSGLGWAAYGSGTLISGTDVILTCPW